MNSSKVILDKIISDNDAIIQSNLQKANEQAAEIIAKAEAAAATKIAEAEAGLKASYDEVIRRSVVVANLDAKKALMSAKSAAIDELFEHCKQGIGSLDKKRYLTLCAAMIEKHAEDGDVVVISLQDKGKITQKFVDDIAKKMGIKLTLSKEPRNFSGGVILEGKASDKNLSFDVELMSIREDMETEIAKLFEE